MSCAGFHSGRFCSLTLTNRRSAADKDNHQSDIQVRSARTKKINIITFLEMMKILTSSFSFQKKVHNKTVGKPFPLYRLYLKLVECCMQEPLV